MTKYVSKEVPGQRQTDTEMSTDFKSIGPYGYTPLIFESMYNLFFLKIYLLQYDVGLSKLYII